MKCCLLTAIVSVLPTFCVAQDHSQKDHNAHMMQQGGMQQMGALPEMAPAPVQAGQSAFAAIQEIVTLMDQDPETDWFTVNIDALREHLVDMNNVTLFADVETQGVDGGAVFTVTSDNPKVVQSIRNMVMAHAAMVSSEAGWTTQAGHAANGATLTVIGDDSTEDKIRALGFFGILTLGMHHQAHHLALAQGANPHAH